VACARELKRRYSPDAGNWTIERGDVLDPGYLSSLGQFDVVYSWGVLHHTGDMKKALANVVGPVASGGKLFIAIYNDQGVYSRAWNAVKRCYNRWPGMRFPIIAVFAPYFWARSLVAGLLVRIIEPNGPRGARLSRGMAFWPDLLDWLGGYPFEVATPALISHFFHRESMRLEKCKTVGRRSGNNEYVFVKP
jgi:2-polyprenyl-6-hydroxyphenyl methylase/3-demethylubiquinone-9 3-methyltransferase